MVVVISGKNWCKLGCKIKKNKKKRWSGVKMSVKSSKIGG
jgi:hypothetical protein